MQTNIFADKKIKELTVSEFLNLLNGWADDRRKSDEKEDTSWLKGYDELAAFLGCSVTTEWRLVKSRLTPDCYRKIGGSYYFDKDAILKRFPKKYVAYAAK